IPKLTEAIKDEEVLCVLRYRSKLATFLRTFGRPWLNMATRTGGFIYSQWNQTKAFDYDGGSAFGAYTGRFSSTPNLQNIPSKIDNPDLYRLPVEIQSTKFKGKDTPLALPMLREFVTA